MLTRAFAISVVGALLFACVAQADQASTRSPKGLSGERARVRSLSVHKKHRKFLINPTAVTEGSAVDKKTGNLIACWQGEGRTGHYDITVVPTRYAMFIEWPYHEYDPQWAKHLKFVFYDNVRKKTYSTRSYLAFLNVLASQPKNIEIFQMDTCTVTRDWMPGNEELRLAKVLKAGNRRVTHEPEAWIDGCVEGETIYPGDKSAPK
jgi:hypothetical protein